MEEVDTLKRARMLEKQHADRNSGKPAVYKSIGTKNNWAKKNI